MGMGRRHGWWVLVLFLAVVTIGAGSLWWQSRSVRHAIAEIEAEMAAGRHAIAARRLNQLLLGAFTNDQAAYLLGVCEQARGRTQAADQAWARVAPGSSFFSRAISDRLTLMLESGRFADGEKLIDEAANDPRVNPTALRILLAPAFIQQGRLDDAERLIEERWQHLHDTGEEASELAVNLARLTLEMRWRPVPVESVRASLDRAAALAPDDDRVWLGQANLALQTGAVDVAKSSLPASGAGLTIPRSGRPASTGRWLPTAPTPYARPSLICLQAS
jgi:hypothetical protein